MNVGGEGQTMVDFGSKDSVQLACNWRCWGRDRGGRFQEFVVLASSSPVESTRSGHSRRVAVTAPGLGGNDASVYSNHKESQGSFGEQCSPLDTQKKPCPRCPDEH